MRLVLAAAALALLLAPRAARAQDDSDSGDDEPASEAPAGAGRDAVGPGGGAGLRGILPRRKPPQGVHRGQPPTGAVERLIEQAHEAVEAAKPDGTGTARPFGSPQDELLEAPSDGGDRWHTPDDADWKPLKRPPPSPHTNGGGGPGGAGTADPSKGGAGGAGGGTPVTGKHVTAVYEHVADMPAHQASFGLYFIHHPDEAVAVAFYVPKAASGPLGALCDVSRNASTSDQCCFQEWISESPGGNALCETICTFEGSHASGGVWPPGYPADKKAQEVRWLSGGGSVCSLQAGRKYYCNLTTGGWDANGRIGQNPRKNGCGGGIAAGAYEVAR